MSTLNIQLLCRRLIDFPELAIFASRPGAMINRHWLKLVMACTIFHGPKVFEPLKFDCNSLPLIQEGQLSVSEERMHNTG